MTQTQLQYSEDGQFVWNGTQWIIAPPKPIYHGKKTNHILHLLLSVFTAGLWIPVWIVVSMVNAPRKERVA